MALRCAIYTRKSSDEGLKQDFNSLAAQREACSAYIVSQTSEGWVELPDRYDDGGFSGATLKRPALQRLLTDVKADKVDVIVVYKVDRLSRSLIDFAKLVDVFDTAKTSFVAITQAFNTTTSLGRLTLNMLLSFAQFEREVTAERIRDKIAASKAKGMWMGGVAPLGYRPDGRSLAIVDEHADIIRTLFHRFLESGSAFELQKALDQENFRVPPRNFGERVSGGHAFGRGQLTYILRNRIYIGEIAYQGRNYAGLHPPIVEQSLFDRVQFRLDEIEEEARLSPRMPTSLLAGKLFDDNGDPLWVSHTKNRQGVRYRYYKSRRIALGESQDGLRIPALELERLVTDRLTDAVRNPLELASQPIFEKRESWLSHCAERGDALAKQVQRPAEFRQFVQRVEVRPDIIRIVCDFHYLATLLNAPVAANAPSLVTFTLSTRKLRVRRAVRFVQSEGRERVRAPNSALLASIAQARAWWLEILEGKLNVTQIAEREGLAKSYVSRVLRLAFLSPRVIDAALAGRLKSQITGAFLRRQGAISPSWRAQAQAMIAPR